MRSTSPASLVPAQTEPAPIAMKPNPSVGSRPSTSPLAALSRTSAVELGGQFVGQEWLVTDTHAEPNPAAANQVLPPGLTRSHYDRSRLRARG